MSQAWALLRADSNYTDLTQTQYADALDWLTESGLLSDQLGGPFASEALVALPVDQIHQILFTRALEASSPLWLPDADILVSDTSEIPQDAASLAAELGIPGSTALSAIREVHGRIDLEKHALVGSDGEAAFVRLLESRWPGSTTHVALTDDGFGYDVVFSFGPRVWHIEVKSTTRRGRLAVYLSRHEHEVALADPNWRLVVVGLDAAHELAALATVDHVSVCQKAPKDLYQGSAWQSVRHHVSSSDLQPGLSFLGAGDARPESFDHTLLSGGRSESAFAWMPRGPWG